MDIQYKVNPKVTSSEFIKILNTSSLGERRPIDDIKTINGMIQNANIIITATLHDEIIGIARAVTDFHYRILSKDWIYKT